MEDEELKARLEHLEALVEGAHARIDVIIAKMKMLADSVDEAAGLSTEAWQKATRED
jgi:hypothetical protein